MKAIKEKFNEKFTNSAAIASGALWYPFSENPPTDATINDKFPIKSITIDNSSSQDIKLILDPVAGSSGKEFIVPNGKTFSIENRDQFTCYQIAVENSGALEIAIGEIKLFARNY